METFRSGSSEAVHNSPLAALPTELLTEMLAFLPIRDIFCAVTCACQEWRELLMDQPEWWLGLICESLGLDRAGESGQFVVNACEVNEDRSGSSTYFLLAHFLSKFHSQHPTLAITGLTRLTSPVVPRLDFLVKPAVAKPKKGLFNLSSVRSVNVSLGSLPALSERADAYPGQIVEYQRSSENVAIALGDPVSGIEWDVRDAKFGKVGVVIPKSAVDNVVQSEDEVLYLRRHSHSNLFTGVPVFGREPWSALSAQRKQRVALGLLFMLVDGQDLIADRLKHDHAQTLLDIQSSEAHLEMVVYSLEMVLACVLDRVALRCLVQMKRT